MNNILKWTQTIKISWSNFTTYRLNFFLQVIGPGIVFFFIKFSLWSSVYGGDKNLIIGGYNFLEMIQYHAWTMIVLLLTQGMTGTNLSEDIRLGRISNYLIYPMNFWEFHTASFLAMESLQILISTVTIFLISTSSYLEITNGYALLHGFLYCIYVSTFWFALQYLTGILAFWLEETWIIRVMLQIVSVFLSGAIIPLELFPSSLVKLLDYTPFPYLTYYPIKIFMGEIGFFTKGYLVLTLWLILVILINKIIWKRGIRLYTAAGM